MPNGAQQQERARRQRGHTYEYEMAAWEAGGRLGERPLPPPTRQREETTTMVGSSTAETALHDREADTLVDGFTVAALRAAFEQVQDAADWKAPIRATIPIADLAVTAAAIEFYTATPVRVGTVDYRGGLVAIAADGYRAGPAGDH